MIKPKQSIGGTIMAKRQREAAITKYLINPIFCQNCLQSIIVRDKEKVSMVKIRKFCSMKCSAIFNNRKRYKPSYCACGSIKQRKSKQCNLCNKIDRAASFDNIPITQSSRGYIGYHARARMKDEQRICAKCS